MNLDEVEGDQDDVIVSHGNERHLVQSISNMDIKKLHK